MKPEKRLLALILGGCLLVGLAACGAPSETTSGAPGAKEIVSDENVDDSNTVENPDTEEIATEQEGDESSSDSEEKEEDSVEGTAEKTDDETAEEAEQDITEDGESREDITIGEALELVIDQFGTEDSDSGYAYDYSLERADEIDGQAYYIYRQTWAPDEEDAEAGAKVLCYIFVATDGSVMYTGVVDGEESVIDYDTQITL